MQAFPKAEAKWPISSGGGSLPIWSRDGRELYFIAPDREMMAVEVHASADQKFEPGVAKPLFETHMNPGLDQIDRWFDVSRDGRFLLPTQTASLPITIVVNWQSELKNSSR